MTNIHVPDKDGYMVDPLKVVHSILVSDITFPTQKVECRRMNFHQLLLGHSGHTGHALPHLVEQSAIEIGTSTVAPGNNGQQVILAERLKIFGTKNSMGS